MRSFSGFPPGKTRSVRLPEPLFTELIPLIDDLDELKTTLHVLYLLEQQQGAARYVERQDLLADPLLLAALGEPTAGAVEAALERAVERGTLLRAQAAPGATARRETIYFANTPKGRAALESLRRGEPLPETQPALRTNIFVLYEENIGPLTPLIVDELREAEDAYPDEWVEAAFREAVALNKRSWRYIRAILERWHNEGRQDETDRPNRQEDRRRYIEGKYRDYIEH
ncbi:MAG: DnaD domain protein [Anaerolineae bacterium]|nr:DnaD domain protein [Anaerolineae bacterium]